jgi:hypothetical protein
MHKLNCFMSVLKDKVRLVVKVQGPRTLGEAYALAKVQEEYLATVKRSSRPTYEANRGNSSQSLFFLITLGVRTSLRTP